jgi:hypothetical protein
LTTFFFEKHGNFKKKEGTFDVNLVFTATLACTKRALFITKKGTFSPLKRLRPCNWGKDELILTGKIQSYPL